MARPLPLLLLLAAALLPAGSAAATVTAFRDCVAGLGERAAAAGVNGDLIARVLPALSPLERVIALDRSQPEFVQTFPAYLEARVTESRVDKGRELLERHGPFLRTLLARYGVPPRYLLAFWGLETNYGGYLGKVPTLDSLATLACDARRSEFFAGEFVNALQLVEREALPLEQLVGSWAGAVGHTQFMPSSYLRYAVDGDGDGRIDLWQSERDALASGANFLRSLGWEPGLRWGRLVELPAGFAYEQTGFGKAQSLRAWAAAGVTRAGGAPLPALDLEAALLLPSGHRGPAFLVYDNFRVVMRWNASQSYALAVGLLADRLAGAPPLRLPPELAEPLRKADIVGAQRALNALGLDAGAADGIIGSRTRAALRAFQLEQGLPADGYPDANTLEALQRRALP
ncbi:lytic murein transglycosylase [Pseudohaliea rubra]|uniref:Membrane-bound lytic murein transglycosylase B n=1 Tax=Pseudohaliea rubra DSM 19751 TaxID=1265313 RepID=A0A095VMP2_9GAMM|nr:lytic murein transglycosylase [Pseudohaliea rubra]KGE02625.1 Membrane-bound lytic murein transglycosylase B precursor [Pseudohaliea rubra DSM 19751]